MRQGPQPGAETAAGVVGERGHLVGEPEPHLLGDVAGIGFLKVPAAAPLVDHRAVVIDKLLPGGLIDGAGLGQPNEQTDARWRLPGTAHGSLLLRKSGRTTFWERKAQGGSVTSGNTRERVRGSAAHPDRERA